MVTCEQYATVVKSLEVLKPELVQKRRKRTTTQNKLSALKKDIEVIDDQEVIDRMQIEINQLEVQVIEQTRDLQAGEAMYNQHFQVMINYKAPVVVPEAPIKEEVPVFVCSVSDLSKAQLPKLKDMYRLKAYILLVQNILVELGAASYVNDQFAIHSM